MFNFRKFFSNFVNTPPKLKASPPPASAPAVRKTPPSGAATAVKKVTNTSGASSRAIKPTPPKKVVQNAASQAPLIKPDSKKLNKSVASAEVYALAKGNPLAQNVLKALLHEGKPAHLSSNDYLTRFPQYGWNEDDTAGGKQLLGAIEALYVQDEVDVRAEIIRDILSSSWMVAPSSTDWAYRYLHAEEIAQNPENFQRLLEDAFGYTIEINIDKLSGDADQLRQLQRLAESNLAIVEYFNKLGLPGSVIFQKFFASTSEGDAITVYLGADDATKGAALGLTPFGELENLYLGSNTSIGTITHEFFHQLDRYFYQCGPSCLPDGTSSSLSNYIGNHLVEGAGIPLNPQYIYEVGSYQQSNSSQYNPTQVILGFVGQGEGQGDYPELFADLGMTAVLDGLVQQVYVQKDDGTYELFPVEWATNEDGTLKTYAELVKAYLENLFKGLLV